MGSGFQEKWHALTVKCRVFGGKVSAVKEKVDEFFAPVGRVFGVIGKWLYRLRKVFMAIPVFYGMVRLAGYNSEHLPDSVGILLQETGEYAYMMSRQQAVFGPMVVTVACLLLMFFSRRSLYPWIISIFSLVLPLLILVTNLYPF